MSMNFSVATIDVRFQNIQDIAPPPDLCFATVCLRWLCSCVFVLLRCCYGHPSAFVMACSLFSVGVLRICHGVAFGLLRFVYGVAMEGRDGVVIVLLQCYSSCAMVLLLCCCVFDMTVLWFCHEDAMVVQ